MIGELWWGLVRFGFRLLYNELAFTYDIVSKIVSLGAWRCWQRTALKHLEPAYNMPILELAHGTGNLQLDLHARGYRSIGYDLSPDMGHIAANKLTRHQIPPKLIRGYAQQLPFPANTFPAIVCTFPTPFIIEPNTLAEVYRIVQPGGRVIIVPSGVLTGDGIVKSFLEWLYKITGQREGDPSTFTQAFADVGFTVAVIQEACPHSIATVVIASKPSLD